MTTHVRKTAAFAAIGLAVLLQGACASRKGPPDPEKVQQEMTAKLDSEQDLIRSTVEDSQRADRLIAHLEDRDRLIASHRETVEKYRLQMKELNADYGAERTSFDNAVAAYNEARSTAQRQFIDLTKAMKREVTAEEWEKIAKYQINKLNPRELAYEQTAGAK